MSSSSYGLIFAILTTGYLALKFSNFTRYKVIKYSNQELFLASGVAGTIIYFFGGIGHRLILHSDKSLNSLNTIILEYPYSLPQLLLDTPLYVHELLQWFEFLDPNVHRSLIGFLIVILIILLSNFRYTKVAIVDKEIMLRNDGIEILLLESLKSLQKTSADDYSLVAVTLTNYKVYIGIVTTHFFSPHGNESFLLWPIFSGFRKKEDNQLIANVTYVYEYKKLLQEVSIDELDKSYVAIPVDKVISVSDFDEEIYYDQLLKYKSENGNTSLKANGYKVLNQLIKKTIKYINSV